MKRNILFWRIAALAIALCFAMAQAVATADEVIYSEGFHILKDSKVKWNAPEQTQAPDAATSPEATPAPAAHREVIVTCEIADVLEAGQEFTLRGELIGYDDVRVSLQWQYDDGKDQDEDGVPDGWRDAPGDSQALAYSVQIGEDTLNAQWRLCVTIAE